MNQSHSTVARDFAYHAPTDMTAEIHETVRRNYAQLAHWVIDNVPQGDARKNCIDRLRESMFWANGAIACETMGPTINVEEFPQS